MPCLFNGIMPYTAGTEAFALLFHCHCTVNIRTLRYLQNDSTHSRHDNQMWEVSYNTLFSSHIVIYSQVYVFIRKRKFLIRQSRQDNNQVYPSYFSFFKIQHIGDGYGMYSEYDIEVMRLFLPHIRNNAIASRPLEDSLYSKTHLGNFS
jgi:hypothetical protein